MKKIKALIQAHFETALILLILLGILATIFLVHYKFAFLNFFFLPVILSGYYLGKRRAVLTASLCILLVVLYIVFSVFVLGRKELASLDEILSIITWAGFLILTGSIIGFISDQRGTRLKNLQLAYVGVLEIILKYLEVADEKKPRLIRISHLAGKIAKALNLSKFNIENIKSAALFLESDYLRSNLPLFEQVSAFYDSDLKLRETKLSDRERILLDSTAKLLKEIEPLLESYFLHYVKEAKALDKQLNQIPLGSCIIALADLYDRLVSGAPIPQLEEEIKEPEDIQKLSGRSFPALAVEALFKVTLLSNREGRIS